MTVFQVFIVFIWLSSFSVYIYNMVFTAPFKNTLIEWRVSLG